MKLKLFYILLFLFPNFETKAQLEYLPYSKNLFYLEAGGNGGFASINYERLFFTSSNLHFSSRIGLTTYCLNC